MIDHGTTRAHRIHRSPSPSGLNYLETRSERYCAHCATWVPVYGVTGALHWMATHRDGDCTQENSR